MNISTFMKCKWDKKSLLKAFAFIYFNSLKGKSMIFHEMLINYRPSVSRWAFKAQYTHDKFSSS